MAGLSRVPLRVLLPVLVVSLVAAGAVAVGVAGVSGTRGSLVAGKPPPADLDRMMRRVADEAARMETLTDKLDLPSA